MTHHETFMKAAIEEARQGLAEGGIPIGSVLVRAMRISGFKPKNKPNKLIP